MKKKLKIVKSKYGDFVATYVSIVKGCKVYMVHSASVPARYRTRSNALQVSVILTDEFIREHKIPKVKDCVFTAILQDDKIAIFAVNVLAEVMYVWDWDKREWIVKDAAN